MNSSTLKSSLDRFIGQSEKLQVILLISLKSSLDRFIVTDEEDKYLEYDL